MIVVTIFVAAAFVAGLYVGFDRGRVFFAVDEGLTLALYYGIAVPLFCIVVLCCLPFAWKGRRP